MQRPASLIALFAISLPSCALSPDLPEQPPSLADMEAPLNLRGDPDDEAARAALPAGTFSGLYLRDARDTLEAKLNEPAAVVVDRIVENSPAARAGLALGDLLLEAQVDGGESQPITTPSQWRKLELTATPGAKVAVIIDRAGREAETELALIARVRPAPRAVAERYREDQRVGVVFRTATEVEARAAGLGPGAGAVLVGMSARSPWRRAGLRFEDLVVAVNGSALTHPQQLLTAIREADEETLQLSYSRAGTMRTVTAPLTRRSTSLNEFSVPLLFNYEADRGRREWSVLLGLVSYRSTAAAWRFRLMWLIGIGGGDADELQEAGS